MNMIFKTSRNKHLMRNLAISCIQYGTISTTLARAKALKMFLEPLITKAKKTYNSEPAVSLHYRRLVLARLGNNQATCNKLCELAAQYLNRPGGYLRLTKTKFRKVDGALIAAISWC